MPTAAPAKITSVELDIVGEETDAAGEPSTIHSICSEIAEVYGLHGYRIVNPFGPGGGWPVIDFYGFDERINRLESDYMDGELATEQLFASVCDR